MISSKKRKENYVINELDAIFCYITDTHFRPHRCKLINIKNCIGLSTISPLFENYHIIIKYEYNNIKMEQEALIVKKLNNNIYLLNFLAFSANEQRDLDTFIEASLRKRF